MNHEALSTIGNHDDQQTIAERCWEYWQWLTNLDYCNQEREPNGCPNNFLWIGPTRGLGYFHVGTPGLDISQKKFEKSPAEVFSLEKIGKSSAEGGRPNLWRRARACTWLDASNEARTPGFVLGGLECGAECRLPTGCPWHTMMHGVSDGWQWMVSIIRMDW